jgi:tripartite-type tricarboxylate transporter receptor subunit TctC
MGSIAGPNEIKSYVDSGELKVLANLGSSKTDEFGDIAFIKELKPSYPGFDTWTAIVAPKGTPKEITDLLAEVFDKTLQDPEVIANFRKTGTEPAYAGPEELGKLIETSAKASKEVMLKAGIVKE